MMVNFDFVGVYWHIAERREEKREKKTLHLNSSPLLSLWEWSMVHSEIPIMVFIMSF